MSAVTIGHAAAVGSSQTKKHNRFNNFLLHKNVPEDDLSDKKFVLDTGYSSVASELNSSRKFQKKFIKGLNNLGCSLWVSQNLPSEMIMFIKLSTTQTFILDNYYCLNFSIYRYASGTVPWGNPNAAGFEPQKHDDGYLEVIGFTYSSLVCRILV